MSEEKVLELPKANPPAAAPRAVMQLMVTVLSNGQVGINGPLDKKGDCITALAAAIQAVIAHQPNKIAIPTGPIPPVTPFKY